MRAVLLLSLLKLKNSLRTLLSDPRKLVPFAIIVGLVGLSLVFSSFATIGRDGVRPANTIDPSYLHAAMAFVMVFISVGAIDNGLGDALMAFLPADVDYLFPSPISRRTVLAYRLPAVFFSAVFQGLFFVYLIHALGGSMPVEHGSVRPAAGSAMFAVILSTGFYMNLALTLSLNFPQRQGLRKFVWIGALFLTLVVAYTWWSRGFDAVAALLSHDLVRLTFMPAMLAADVLFLTTSYQPLGNELAWLGLGYVLSLVPLFAGNGNWYEQSIVSSEKIALIRQAAKGGTAGLLAMRAAKYKRRTNKTYLVHPFGQGPMALVWAHLSAAAKRPFANFVLPAGTGVLIGLFSGLVGHAERIIGPILAIGLLFYSTFGFMASARTASEAALRRRELLSPLPLRGWESVAANLSMPMLAGLLMSVAFAITYATWLGTSWTWIVAGVLTVFPIRLAARMVLQYAVVLGYPDFADKVQQIISQGVYYLLTMPFMVGEVLVCIPAILFRSFWLGLILLTLYEIGTLAILLFLTGKATERAVATGEAVNLWQVARR